MPRVEPGHGRLDGFDIDRFDQSVVGSPRGLAGDRTPVPRGGHGSDAAFHDPVHRPGAISEEPATQSLSVRSDPHLAHNDSRATVARAPSDTGRAAR